MADELKRHNASSGLAGARRRWTLAIAGLGAGAAIAFVGFAAARDTPTRVVVAAASNALTTTGWVDPCDVTLPPELANDPEAIADAAAQERMTRADLGEICLPPDEFERVSKEQARADAARLADPNYKPGPLPIPIPLGVPDPPGLHADGTIWFWSTVFVPSNEWVEPPNSESAARRVTAGYSPGGAPPEYRVREDIGGVAVMHTPGGPANVDLYRAPEGVGRLKITKVMGDTVYLTADVGEQVTFNTVSNSFTVR